MYRACLIDFNLQYATYAVKKKVRHKIVTEAMFFEKLMHIDIKIRIIILYRKYSYDLYIGKSFMVDHIFSKS